MSHTLLPHALTESINPATSEIDRLPTLEMLREFNREDASVPLAIACELERIAKAVDEISKRMNAGGRLVYMGAGTSGRLGVLDASELPPTFSTRPGQVIALIAGGEDALIHSVEGAEDDLEAGRTAIDRLNLSPLDCLIGIAASGRTPYVIGGMQAAHQKQAFIASLCCNRPSPMEDIADIGIAPQVGPEILTGSTRLKAGTAQKMVLNMISTAVMIRLGKTYGNLMVEVQPTNAKLRDRACRIIQQVCKIEYAQAETLLNECQGDVKVAIIVSRAGISLAEAKLRLEKAGGVIRKALE